LGGIGRRLQSRLAEAQDPVRKITKAKIGSSVENSPNKCKPQYIQERELKDKIPW
jgi:hypothetical protein